MRNHLQACACKVYQQLEQIFKPSIIFAHCSEWGGIPSGADLDLVPLLQRLVSRRKGCRDIPRSFWRCLAGEVPFRIWVGGGQALQALAVAHLIELKWPNCRSLSIYMQAMTHVIRALLRKSGLSFWDAVQEGVARIPGSDKFWRELRVARKAGIDAGGYWFPPEVANGVAC